MRYGHVLATCLLTALTVFGGQVRARAALDAVPEPPSGATSPGYCITEHNIGRMALATTNIGTFGDGFSRTGSVDCHTGLQVQSCEFPKNSRTKYLFAAAIWIGAVLNRDTLVSVGADGWSFVREFNPDDGTMGETVYRSNVDPARPEYRGAISEQDYVAVYYDTCRNCGGTALDVLDNRPHIPLNIEVTEASYAWSYSYAQDFVLFDYGIRNIGRDRLRRVYMGIYVDADIYSLILGNGGAQDDLCGFREKQPALYIKPPCRPDSDVVNIAWTVDNDGDFAQAGILPVPGVTATRIVRTPSDSLQVSFNWWISNADASLDFGPQTRRGIRDFGTGGLGTPEGDRNKFYILSNGEFDYDQPRVATIGSLDSIWLPPPSDRAGVWATGLDTRYVLSFGPFDIEPGQTLPISLAYVGGVDFHRGPENFGNLPNNPDSWYEGVNFDSLGTNATWADWVYDNPGVDTDSDGYSGEYTLCEYGDSSWECVTIMDTTADPDTPVVVCDWSYEEVDTIWRKGDGVPDFRGATPPPSPATYSIRNASGELIRGLRVEPRVGAIKVVWNGVLTENTPDVFSREYDFEGYRVWIGRDERADSYSMLCSYDVEDYNRWDYNSGSEVYQLNESPFSLAELRCLYADSCNDTSWHPLDYPRHRPLVLPPSAPGEDPQVHYFEPQDFNRSVFGNEAASATTPIRKIYPDAPKPPLLDPDSIRVYYPGEQAREYLTEEGFLKYYEYEYTVTGLLPTVPYWINVTAFDYGSPQSGLDALETSPTTLPLITYPLDQPGPGDADGNRVFVWPNPYRLDADYRDRGFEGRGEPDRDDDRVRLIHFANLPDACTIRVYSLDGDLVREFEHPNSAPPSGCPVTPHEDCWELITRNSQQVVSGLYYWTVEDRSGNIQIGKLTIIL